MNKRYYSRLKDGTNDTTIGEDFSTGVMTTDPDTYGFLRGHIEDDTLNLHHVNVRTDDRSDQVILFESTIPAARALGTSAISGLLPAHTLDAAKFVFGDDAVEVVDMGNDQSTASLNFNLTQID